MVNKANKHYGEYALLVDDLLTRPEVLRLDRCRHHYGVSRMRHSINVSYYSFVICKRLHMDYRAAARAGLLHDLFHYECHKKRFGVLRHAAIHPRLALRNAERITRLTPLERDIILKHMWLCGRAVPRYKESYVVSLVDKYSAVYEALYGLLRRVRFGPAYSVQKKMPRKDDFFESNDGIDSSFPRRRPASHRLRQG